LDRLWALAQYLRARTLRRLPDDELRDLVVEAVLYCVDKFKERHPPREGLCRQTTEDRFTFFFGRKLAWKLEDHRRWMRRGRLPPGDSIYRGPRGDRHDTARQRRSPTALLSLVHRAIARLDADDATLLGLRVWEGATWGRLAAMHGFSSRFQAKRKLDRVYRQLRDLVLEELQDVVVQAEDDFDAVGAALAA
jgi:hypothetical protein